MRYPSQCPFCNKNVCTERHHKFPQTKPHIKAYGKKLIDAEFNIIYCCNACNGSHSNIPDWAIWKEERFRLELGKRGYQIPTGTKSYQNKMMGKPCDTQEGARRLKEAFKRDHEKENS